MRFYVVLLMVVFAFSCSLNKSEKVKCSKPISIIFDTDANNELDDQHALAYLLLNDSVFNVLGLTVNATYNGGCINEHYAEANRVVALCGKSNQINIFKGAQGKFDEITPIISEEFDGSEAVNFIVDEAKKANNQKIVVLAVGKLTNIALAIKKDSSIIDKIRLVWLGSNYPEPGEYNLVNDIAALNYLLKTEMDFEMAVCRYGKSTGTDAVRVTQEQIVNMMTGKGPRAKDSVVGRHGDAFLYFGNYSVNLFDHVDYYGNPPSRALFDMAAVAILKNHDWAKSREISAPSMVDSVWIDHPGNKRKIKLWEDFNSEAILKDFFDTFQ